ncbi:hypothetical protein BH09BAC6_BH09BAC6_07210 [soil metagenome]|jgi:hypothetical protein
MKKIYYSIFIPLFLITAAGCKLDTPVYPSGGTATTGPGTGIPTGTTANNGEGLPIGPLNTVQFQLDGVISTYKTTNFVVHAPHSPEATHSPATGETIISAIGPNILTDYFTMSFLDSKAGVYDIEFADFPKQNNDQSGIGRVKVTLLSYSNGKGSIQGTFNVDMVDNDGSGKKHSHCPGSFNIKM